MYNWILDNLDIEIRSRPSKAELQSAGVSSGHTLFGMYVGVPLPERSHYHSMILPDQIVIYQQPHEETFHTEVEVVHQLRRTLFHEIGHYLGMDDDRLRELGLD